MDLTAESFVTTVSVTSDDHNPDQSPAADTEIKSEPRTLVHRRTSMPNDDSPSIYSGVTSEPSYVRPANPISYGIFTRYPHREFQFLASSNSIVHSNTTSEDHTSKPKQTIQAKPKKAPVQVSKSTECVCERCYATCAFVFGFLFVVSTIAAATFGLLYYAMKQGTDLEDEFQILKEGFDLGSAKGVHSLSNSYRTKIPNMTVLTEIYYLIHKTDFISWCQPSGIVSLTWHRGEAVKLHVITDRGLRSSKLLGDPILHKGSSFRTLLFPSESYALELEDKATHTLLSVSNIADLKQFEWRQTNYEDLIISFPQLKDFIQKFI